MTGFGSPSPGAKKFLVSSEKEFKDRHTGTISRSRFTNAKQRESRAEVLSPRWRVSSLKREHCTRGSQDLKLFIGVCRHGVVSPDKRGINFQPGLWITNAHVRPWVVKAVGAVGQQNPAACHKL